MSFWIFFFDSLNKETRRNRLNIHNLTGIFLRLWTWEFAFLDVVLRNTDNVIGTSLKGNTAATINFSVEFWNKTAPKLKELRLRFISGGFRWKSVKNRFGRLLTKKELTKIHNKRRFKFWRVGNIKRGISQLNETDLFTWLPKRISREVFYSQRSLGSFGFANKVCN
ncbi:hypothetical protein RCL_jg3170.t3 [Rhizophagus clarus]|uniref:Uncharacterized protein n=1 Tax=Rhizophagus clarus TaxID=94130 RepID=A0A8H3MC81_9GLOM|nr:hypothetical protein RCL_jg3170.t3 [Rhizophagus clarus]